MKFNYKRDTLLGFIGGVVLIVSGVLSLKLDNKIRAIVMLILGLVLIGLGVFCLIKSKKEFQK